MMKFFALVALAMFATANASTAVTGGAITRGTTYLTGVDGGDLVITFTTNAGLADQDVVTFTPLENAAAYFSGASPTCTATGTGIDSITSAATTGTGVLEVTVTTSAGVAASVEVVITCTDNLSVNAAAGAKTFTIETTSDATVVTVDPGYTVTSGVTAFSASRGTSLVTAVAPGTLIFGFTPTTALAHSATITLTSSVALYTASQQISCTATYADISVAVPTFVVATTVSDATGKVLTLVLGATAATDIFPATKAATITCTAANMAVNTAAGDVKFTVGTVNVDATGDVGPTVETTGYTITATQMCHVSSTDATSDTDWTVGPTETACAAGIESCEFRKTVTSSATTYYTGCSIFPGTPYSPFTTGCKVETSEPFSWIYYPLNTGSKSLAEVKAIVDPITAICPSTSAASATAGMSMLTMLALAGVAMRQ